MNKKPRAISTKRITQQLNSITFQSKKAKRFVKNALRIRQLKDVVAQLEREQRDLELRFTGAQQREAQRTYELFTTTFNAETQE